MIVAPKLSSCDISLIWRLSQKHRRNVSVPAIRRRTYISDKNMIMDCEVSGSSRRLRTFCNLQWSRAKYIRLLNKNTNHDLRIAFRNHNHDMVIPSDFSNTKNKLWSDKQNHHSVVTRRFGVRSSREQWKTYLNQIKSDFGSETTEHQEFWVEERSSPPLTINEVRYTACWRFLDCPLYRFNKCR